MNTSDKAKKNMLLGLKRDIYGEKLRHEKYVCTLKKLCRTSHDASNSALNLTRGIYL